MYLSSSFWRKVVATLGAAVGFVFVYETTTRDSRFTTLVESAAPPQPGTQHVFTATAYCKGETTASGVAVRTGIAAADPALLPVGSVVQVAAPDAEYDGIWTIMDTGPAVQGRTIDLYMWSCHEALRFGRKPVRLTVLRLGWHPQNSEPGRIERLFRQRERDRARAPLPAAPVAAEPALPAAPAPTPPQ